MTLSAVNLCWDASHQPFASEGAVKIQNLNSERPASKIIRAVLRDSDIDPQDAVNYSIHRCYCKFKIKIEDDDEDETFNPESTLDELEIKDGDSVFIKKINVEEEAQEDQDDTSFPLSRKRKERDEKEVTPESSPLPSAPTPKSHLKNLAPQAAATARSISELLGGDTWKTQSIGKLGSIQTKSAICLQALLRAIKTSLQIPQVATVEAGSFNSDLVEALARAYHQRVTNPKKCGGGIHLENLSLLDYEKANELLKGKIRDDGSWERSSLNHLDQSALSKPAERFPLNNTGLSGPNLTAARAVCLLWNNDKWINQAPMPGLSPVHFGGDIKKNPLLRQIAQLTKVKQGEATPDGIPPLALQALKDSINKNKKAFDSNDGGSKGGWSQIRCLKDALALLKERIGGTNEVSSSMTFDPSKTSGSRGTEKRKVRRRLTVGK